MIKKNLKGYDKILKTHDYFKISTLISVLIKYFLFYMENTVKYLHNTRCRFYIPI